VDREEHLARYVLMDVRMPTKKDLNEDIEWTARCFGFLETRDVNRTAARIFSALIYAASEDKGHTSDGLAERVGVTRGAIVHHLNKMMRSGLVIFHGGQYKLREKSLRRTVNEVERDLRRVLEKIEEVASSIDEELSLPHRGT
jgi:predicted transcriptional regulator